LRLLVLLAIGAVACGALPVQAQTLSLAYHRGDTYRYSFHSTATQSITGGGLAIPPTDIDIVAAETVTVNSVDPNGSADLTLTLSNFTVSSGATGAILDTTKGMPDITMNITIAADGHVVSLDGKQVATGNPFLASGAGGGFFITAVLPSGAVKPGDTWTKDYTEATPGGTGGISITTHSKYLRDESLNGVRAAVLETTSNATIDLGTGGSGGLSSKGTGTSDVTSWIDPNSHRVLKSHAKQSNDGTFDFGSSINLGGLSGPISIKGTGTVDLTPA